VGDQAGGGHFEVDWAIAGGTEADRDQHFQLRQAEYDPYKEEGWSISFNIVQNFQRYFSLDAPNVARMIWLLQDLFYYNAVVGVAADGLPFLTNQEESPRGTGFKDFEGNTRVVKSELKTTKGVTKADFSGAPGLIQALEGLVTYAAALTSVGRIRDAGIVLYAYQQVVNGSWTITKAFRYLFDNRL